MNFVQFFNNQQNFPNYWGDATKLFGGLSHSSTPVCYYWLQVVEKIKELNLKTEDWLCLMKKLGDKSISAPTWWKCWRDASLSSGFCYHWHGL